MFADLGHFSYSAIQAIPYEYFHTLYSVCKSEFSSNQVCLLFLQLAFTSLVYPSLILGYMGQAAYLSKHHNLDASYQIGFYIAVPGN